MPITRSTVEQNIGSISNRIHEFDPTSYDWEEWEILFDTYLEVEGIKGDTEKRNLLITALSVQPFKTLISICKPMKPTECSYKELVGKLRSNYARITFPSTERIKFFAKRQDSSETLTDFANDLRDKTSTCQFPSNFYQEALITAFVGDLRNDHVRKHFMQRNLETFEQTINTAKTIESVLIEGSTAKNGSFEDMNINKTDKRHKPSSNTNHNHKSTCSSCGSSDHPGEKCRFRHVTCRSCKKEGHITKGCRSRNFQNTNKVNTLCASKLEQITLEHPIQIQVLINSTQVDLQLDTGSPITLINENVWNKMGRPKLHSIKMSLNSFTGHPIHLKGATMVHVKCHHRTIQLKLFVLNGSSTNILGRDWIDALHLNTKTLDDIASNGSLLNVDFGINNLKELFIRYQEIFKDGLGCCKMKAHLHVKPNVIPKFCKSRSLPFAYRQAVESQLDRLVNDKVLEPINVSKWAAPIVVVPKPDGNVRICADLSTGVNQALDIDQYPLPKPNDLFVALNGGSQLTKIDFSEAYLQAELDDDSKELLVINTHKGLFLYNRLPFGVASAPSIFQKIMDQMLSGLESTVLFR